MKKKIVFTVLLILCLSGLAFGQFEGRYGFGGGLGTAGSIGLNIQMGYLSPAFPGGGIGWSILADMGVGIRHSSLSGDILDYNLGLLAEIFFLPWLGVGIGGGAAYGDIDNMFVPYIRAEIPFMFQWVTLGAGFDYFIWDTSPPTYKINFFIRMRNEMALLFMTMWY